jgi:hypothetical protein
MKDGYSKCLDDVNDLLEWILPRIFEFDRKHRYGIGAEIEKSLFCLLELVTAATFDLDRLSSLRRARCAAHKVVLLIRLARSLNQFSVRQYEHLCKLTTEIGRQLSAWSKYVEAK